MAESRDKMGIMPISDDIIKEALKTELSSIQASEVLVKKTINICQDEINKGFSEKQTKTKAFLPWLYRLGAPLAAGALILVLVFNGQELHVKQNASDTAPMASISSAAGSAASTDDNARSVNHSAKPEMAAMEAPAPEPAAVPTPSEAPSSEPDSQPADLTENQDGIVPEEDRDTQGNMLYSEGLPADLSIFNSRKIGSDNGSMPISEVSPDTLVSIVSLYNSERGKELSLFAQGITRIHTLVPGGVSVNMLKESEDYRELLSGGWYWAVPLNNENGHIENVLYVTAYAEDAAIPVSSRDILYSSDKDKYLITEGFVPAGFAELLNHGALMAMALEGGYGDISDIIIVDINYGMDFLVIMSAQERQLVVPALNTGFLFGLENNRIYTLDELLEFFSAYMGQ